MAASWHSFYRQVLHGAFTDNTQNKPLGQNGANQHVRDDSEHLLAVFKKEKGFGKDLECEAVDLGIAHASLSAFSVELQLVVRLCGEHQVCHCYAASVDKEFNRTAVNVDADFVSIVLIVEQGSPGAQCKGIVVVDGQRFVAFEAFGIVKMMRSHVLPNQ